MDAICNNCKLQFKSNWSIGGGPGSTIYSQGNRVSCPNCGKMADVIDGEYRVDERGISQLLKMFRPDELLRIRDLATSAENAEDFAKGLDQINPSLKSVFGSAILLSKDENFRYWIDRIIKILAILIGGAAINNMDISFNNIGNTQMIKADTTYSKNYERELRLKNLKDIKDKKANKKAKSKRNTPE